MKIFFQAKLFFVFLAGAFVFSACGSAANTNQTTNSANNQSSANSNSTKDDAEEFGKLVNMPAMPEEVTWRETDAKDSKKLIAVLKFSSQNAQAVVAEAEKHKPAVPAALEAENWFPPELIAKSQESGDESLKGTTYGANDFFSETFRNGKLTRISDTDYFVLEMTSF